MAMNIRPMASPSSESKDSGAFVVKSKFGKTREGDDHIGWVFPASDMEEAGAQPDPLNGAKSIRDLYELANPDYNIKKYSVPVL
ncbi:hypothetical protein AKJ16_DCAP25205 [Drosera capensis]